MGKSAPDHVGDAGGDRGRCRRIEPAGPGVGRTAAGTGRRVGGEVQTGARPQHVMPRASDQAYGHDPEDSLPLVHKNVVNPDGSSTRTTRMAPRPAATNETDR